jgi:hypothetical protein
MIGFEIDDDTVANFAHAEGHSHGSAMTIRDSGADGPVPWPLTEVSTARFMQHQTNSWWRGNTFAMNQGDVLPVSFYIYFDRVGWPPTNNCPIFWLVTAGLATHFRLQVVANGAAADVQVLDAGHGVVGTISDGFPDTGRWYRVDMLVKIGNSGDCKVRITDKTDDSVTGSISIEEEDFYGGAETVGVYLQGETGIAPMVMTTVYFGSVVIFNGADDPLDELDYVGDYTIFGSQPDNNTATPDFDGAGASPGTKDDLDIGVWSNLASGSIASKCTYNAINNQGVTLVPFPAGDSRIRFPNAVRYGTSWFGYVTGRPAVTNVRVYFGKENVGGASATLSSVDVPKNTYFKEVRASPTLEAGFLEKQAIGFETIVAAASWFNEAWVMTAFKYPPGEPPVTFYGCVA